VKDVLNAKKEKIIGEIEQGGLKKLKKTKLLRLIKDEIQSLSNYWTLLQILEMINKEFDLQISNTVFYDFCKNNLKKNNIETVDKIGEIRKGVSQNRNTKKEEEKSILDSDELNAIAMYGSSKVQ
jgi:hypothetical protein